MSLEVSGKVKVERHMRHEGQRQQPPPLDHTAGTHVRTPPAPAQYSPCSCKTGTCVRGWSFFCALLWLAAWRCVGERRRGQWEGEDKNRMGFNEGTQHPCKSKWNVKKQYTSNNENEQQVMGENEWHINAKETSVYFVIHQLNQQNLLAKWKIHTLHLI